jgi:hypothetical protein
MAKPTQGTMLYTIDPVDGSVFEILIPAPGR